MHMTGVCLDMHEGMAFGDCIHVTSQENMSVFPPALLQGVPCLATARHWAYSTPTLPLHSIPQIHPAWPICSLSLPAPEKACSKVKGLVAN